MITERYLERDGERLLLRLVVHGAAALDVLTDAVALDAARILLAQPAAGLAQCHLGTFGPFPAALRLSRDDQAAIAVDGPDLGHAFRGDQAIVFYFHRQELLDALMALRAPGETSAA